jgi:RNA polymerase sigma-70 factor (ECF subfamily)
MALGHSSMKDEAAAPAAEPVEFTFEGIYSAHFGFVWRSLRGLGVASSLLDDASHDVFIVVHRRLGDFRTEIGLHSWLYAIVRNVAANYRRSQQRRAASPLLETTLPSHQPSPHDDLADRQAAEFIAEFLATVGDKPRDVFVLVMLEGLNINEVAQILQIPLGTAHTRLRKVRADLERALRRKRASL